jgi:hypothetical protein
MNQMKKKTILISSFIFYSTIMTAQVVTVSKEPRHHTILQNKFVRVLNVWLPPGDTTLFHIHATPSLFAILSNTYTGSQIMGEDWSDINVSVAGTVWYRSFFQDTLVHRVANFDMIPFQANDIEILSSYNKNASSKKQLPYTLLFDNEKASAYQLRSAPIKNQIIKDRGPMIAILISGEALFYYATGSKQRTEIKTGKALYIEPGTAFYFAGEGSKEINMVLFEIK